MYQPAKYQKNDPAFNFNFIREHPFATFIINGERLLATHIPVLAEGSKENFRLYAHIAHNNPQYGYLKDNIEALLIFQGAHGYVSSSWYKEKDISTWDYSAVHVNARLKIQSHEELVMSLQKLVTRFEKEQQHPLYYKDLPDKLLSEHLPLIKGFWCEPFKIEAIEKLHQGFDEDDIHSITTHLEAQKEPLSLCLSQKIKEENDRNH